jgi:hypothetical protein
VCVAGRSPTFRLVVEVATLGAVVLVVLSSHNRDGGRRLMLPVRRELPLRPTGLAAVLLGPVSSTRSSSFAIQRSHRSHPRNVAKLLQLTTETGLTRSWKIPMKQTTKIMTEHTCCTMTVLSATKGQKSYGCSRGFRWRFSRKVVWSV